MYRAKLLWLNAIAFVLAVSAAYYGVRSSNGLPTVIGIGVMIASGGLFLNQWRRK